MFGRQNWRRRWLRNLLYGRFAFLLLQPLNLVPYLFEPLLFTSDLLRDQLLIPGVQVRYQIRDESGMASSSVRQAIWSWTRYLPLLRVARAT
jgi:hypothetical protein